MVRLKNREAIASTSIDLPALRFEPLAERPSKVSLADLGRPGSGAAWFAEWLDTPAQSTRCRCALAASRCDRSRDNCESAGRRRAWRARHQDRVRFVSGRLDRARNSSRACAQRFGGDPRSRAGDRRQDERRRGQPFARPARSGSLARRPTSLPRPAIARRASIGTWRRAWRADRRSMAGPASILRCWWRPVAHRFR